MNPLKTSGKQIFARYKNGIKNITKEKNRSIQNHKTIKSLKQQFKFASMMNSSNGFSFAVPPTFVNSGRGKLGSKMYENNMNRFFNNNTPKINFAISGISSFLLSLLIGFLTLWDDGG